MALVLSLRPSEGNRSLGTRVGLWSISATRLIRTNCWETQREPLKGWGLGVVGLVSTSSTRARTASCWTGSEFEVTGSVSSELFAIV